MRFFRRLFKIIFFTIIILIFLMIFHYTKHGYLMYKSALAEMPLEDKISEIQSKENYTKLSEIPQIYIDAVIAVEDHRFYSHNGIDIIAICRATYNDIKAKKFVEGGSTITQQLAKNTFFTQDKKIERKIAEVFMAFKLEQKYSKNEILELYINTTFFGNGYYTVKEASRGYFNKEPLELTGSEAIMLAGIPNAPSLYNPRNSLKLCLERQRQVISKMIKYGNLTKEKAELILSNNPTF